MKLPLIIVFYLIISFLNFPVHAAAQLPIQHSVIAKKTLKISQYLISEKLDGVRGYWDGTQLWTRQGNKINTPKWFTQNWPDTALDGELWSSRDKFQQIVSCVKRKKIKPACWQDIRFMIFDLPTNKEKFSNRVIKIKELVSQSNSPYVAMIKQFKLESNKTLYQKIAFSIGAIIPMIILVVFLIKWKK